MKRKKETASAAGPSGSRKAKAALNVNKVRRVFTRGKKLAHSAASTASADGNAKAETLEIAGTSKARTVKKGLKTLSKKISGIGRIKGPAGRKKPVSPPNILGLAALAQERKVYRALKLLHIDFKDIKQRYISRTGNITRRSTSLIPIPTSTPTLPETEASTKGLTPDPASSSANPVCTASRKKINNAEQSLPSEESANTSGSAPPLTESAVKHTSPSNQPGSDSKSENPSPGNSTLKKGISRSKAGAQGKTSPDSSTEIMPGTKKARALPKASIHAAADGAFMVPKMSKRFSTSIYSSRRQTVTPRTTTVRDVGQKKEADQVADTLQTAGQTMDSASALRKGQMTRSVRGRSAVRGFQRGSFKGRGITNTSRGRGFALAALSSKGTGTVGRRGRGRKRTRWTHHKVYRSENRSVHEVSEVENLSAADGIASPQNEEPPAKRGRFKKGQTDVQAEEDLDQSLTIAGEIKDSCGAEGARIKSKANSQPVSAKSTEEAWSKGKLSTPKVPRGRAALKWSSRSVEPAGRDRGCILEQVRSTACSRNSSPGGTDLRSRNRAVPRAGRLARSSSLDNLLYETTSPKITRSRTSLSRGSERGGDRIPEDKASDKTTQSEAGAGDSGATPVTSKNGTGPVKRKLSHGSSAETVKGRSGKKKRLLSRLEDSSTHQMPDILLSHRSTRLAALWDSPSASRESSPGSLKSTKRKKFLEQAGAAMDTDTARKEGASSSKSRDKKAVQTRVESENKRSVNTPSWESDVRSVKASKGTDDANDCGEKLGQSFSGLVTCDSAVTAIRAVKGRSRKSKAMKPAGEDTAGSGQLKEEGAVSQLPAPSVEGFRRRRGRPKGSLNKKFRLNVMKHHSKAAIENNLAYRNQFGSLLKSPLKIRADQAVKRGRGRPKKNSQSNDSSSQPMEQSLKSSNVDRTGASVANSTAKIASTLKKGRLPLKSGRLKGLKTEVKKTRRRKKYVPDKETPSESDQQGQEMGETSSVADLSLGDHSYSCETTSGSGRATSSSDTSNEKGRAVSSDIFDQSKCREGGGKSGESNTAGSSTSAEQTTGHLDKKAGKITQSQTSSQSNMLGNLVRMRRESSRNLKKSQRTATRPPLQYRAMLESAVQLKKQPSQLIGLPLPSTGGSQEEMEKESESPSSSLSAGPTDNGDSEMETVVQDLQDPIAEVSSSSPLAASDQPSGSNDTVEAAAQSDSLEGTSSPTELAAPGKPQQADGFTEVAEDSGSHQACEDQPEPPGGELSQVHTEAASKSTPCSESTLAPVPELQAQGDPDLAVTPEPADTHGSVSIPDQVTIPNQTSISDPASVSDPAIDRAEETSVVGTQSADDLSPAEPSAREDCEDRPIIEEVTSRQPEEPVMQREPEEISMQDARELVKDGTTESSSVLVTEQSRNLSEQDVEGLMNSPREEPLEHGEPGTVSGMCSESYMADESLRKKVTSDESDCGSQNASIASSADPSGEAFQKTAEIKPHPTVGASAESETGPENIISRADTSLEGQSQTTPDCKAEPDQAKGAAVSPDSGMQTAAENLPQVCAEGDTSSGRESQAQSASDESLRSDLPAPGQHFELDSAEVLTLHGQLQGDRETLPSTASSFPTTANTGDSQPCLSTEQMEKSSASGSAGSQPVNFHSSEGVCQPDLVKDADSECVKQPDLVKDADSECVKQPDLVKDADSECVKQPDLVKDADSECVKQPDLVKDADSECVKQPDLVKDADSECVKQPDLVKKSDSDSAGKLELVKKSDSDCVGQLELVKKSDSDSVGQLELVKSDSDCVGQLELVKKSDSDCVGQLELVKKSDSDCVGQLELVKKSDSVADIAASSLFTSSSQNADTTYEDPESVGQAEMENQCSQNPSKRDESAERKLNIAQRKQYAISRELKRLQTDEGVQRIMSWHEKKKVKSLGKLLRSKIKGNKGEDIGKEDIREQKLKKPRSSKLYSIDTLSDTRLVIKSGASSRAVSEEKQRVGTPQQLAGSLDREGSTGHVGVRRKWRRGVLSMSSSMDSEDGAPPDITEMPPYKDSSHTERGRSEELSPPPLILPEDLFSEEYYESVPSSTAHQFPDSRIAAVEGAVRGSTVAQGSMTGMDTSQGNETSGTFSEVTAARAGPGRKRGRGKRKYRKMGPASKTGRAPNIRPGPASSKMIRRTLSPKHDPSFVRNMPHLPSEPRTFALRPKMTRSPIEIIAMRQKLEEEAYELEEATRVARKLKRRQAQYGKHAMESESSRHSMEGSCKPCSVVLVDFVKELHLNSIDTCSDQYISDVSYDTDEEDVDDEDEDFTVDLYACHPNDESLDGHQHESVLAQENMNLGAPDAVEDGSAMSDASWKGSVEYSFRRESPEINHSASTEVRKSPPELDSLHGKGYMSNFVDFIQNRSVQPVSLSAKRRPQFRSRTPPVTSGHTMMDSAGSMVSASCTLDSVVTTSSLTTMSTTSPSVVSVPSHAQMVTSAQVHIPHHSACPEDKTVSSSPSRVTDCTKPVDKAPFSTHHHALLKPSMDKSSSPGKLKVFPARRDSEGASMDKMAFTRYLCTKCEFSATNKGTMESHIYRHIPGVTFTCGYCESEFTGLISALTHVKNSHNSKEPKVWISKDINEASLYTEEEIHSCPQHVAASPHSCQQGAGQGESIDGDMAAMQDRPPVIISLVVSGGGERGVQRGERFSSSPLANQRRFACTHCSYCTNVVEDAHQHVRDLHSHSSLFTCYLCDKAFGCSHQDILIHCSATHPDRPQSYKKLPDFYDQELLRMNSGSTDRAKSSEDRGNIFDRMSNLFPSLGPGGELLEDGQLSPQARYLRARDYLYIREGWSKKTSAEADSTTIEDIEVPIDDSTDVDTFGLDSTTDLQLQLARLQEGALGFSATSELLGVATNMGNVREHLLLAEQTALSQDSQHSLDYVGGKLGQTSAVKKRSGSTENTSLAEPDRSGQNTVTALESEHAADGAGDETQTSLKLFSTSERTEHPWVLTKPLAEEDKGDPALIGVGHQPASNDDDDDGPQGEDGENDILVIDLGEEVIEDIADEDVTHCSSPHEGMTEAALSRADSHTAMEKETSCVCEAPDSKAAQTEVSSPNPTGVSTAESCAWEQEEDKVIGIKILSVVSLRDKADISISPARSEHDPTTSPSASGKKLSPAGKSPVFTAGKSLDKSRRKSGSQALTEVDADEVAARNERMVCTYKCHSCSIHSPALSAIVEHLKQHHSDMPLFSCPYCKARKDAFFTEEQVHTHVSLNHPSNYAKNEVSLSEVAKSFVQVLALPSGNRVRGSLIEEDIYMCLRCEFHVPDLDYALSHLKDEHPGLLKYACPVCGTFSDSQQDVVKAHMVAVHGQLSHNMQPAMAMEGVYLTKVICISLEGQYVDHAPPSPSRAAHTTPSLPSVDHAPPSPSRAAHISPSLLSASKATGVVDSLALVSPGAGGTGLSSVPVPASTESPQTLASLQELASLSPFSSSAKPGRHKSKSSGQQQASSTQLRPILPMPGSPAKAAYLAQRGVDGSGVHQFHVTGMTVKDMLDRRTGDPGALPVVQDSTAMAAQSLAVSSMPSGQGCVAPRDTVVDRQNSSVSPCSMPASVARASSTFTAPMSRPVLRVPTVSVSSVLDLTTPSRCSSVDTGTSVNTLTAGGVSPIPASVAATLSMINKQAASLTFPVASMTGSLSVPASPRDKEDPEAFKIFNLKPRTPVPQSLHPASSPLVLAHSTTTSTSPMQPLASTLSSPHPPNLGTVTVASSALFPQQFRLQTFPSVQPASITTLPLAQGGLPLAHNFALPIGAGLPLPQGLTIPISITQPQLLMAPNTFPPVFVPTTNLLGLRGPMPQVPVVAAPPTPAPPPAHQQISDVQTVPVNLSLSQPEQPVPMTQNTRPKPMKTSFPCSSFQPRVIHNRGRGRPKLNKVVDFGLQPRVLGSSTPRPSHPTPLLAPAPEVSRPASTPATRPTESPGLSPTKGVRHGGASQQCVCPYCPDRVILKPWEVAQHIKVLHPGKEVKYNRV